MRIMMWEQTPGVRTGTARSSANKPGSNPALGLNASQPPNQNWPDDNDKENGSFIVFPLSQLFGFAAQHD
jgi:hypothetical protein